MAFEPQIMAVYDKTGEYIGTGCLLDYGEGVVLLVNENYEVPVDQIEHIINFSDKHKPSGYYRI